MDPIDDHSRLDAYAAARRRTMLLSAAWRPMLAGAAGAALVIAAVWVTLPKFSYREVAIDHVVQHDVTVDHVVPKDVQVDRIFPHETVIEIPRIVTVPTPPRSAEEFEGSQPFRDSTINGLFVGPDRNGFRLDSGQTFYPARVIGGKVELASDMLDDVSRLAVGDPIYCAPTVPEGLFECRAWHRGKIEDIVVIPVWRAS